MQVLAEGHASVAAASEELPSTPSLPNLPDPLVAHTLSLMGGHEG